MRTLSDTLTQLLELAEENNLANAEAQVKDLKDKHTDLGEKISQRMQELKVGVFF